MRNLVSVLVLLSLCGACTRNIGPLPEATPEYTDLYFAGSVSGAVGQPAKGILFLGATPASGGPAHIVTRIEVSSWPVDFVLSDLDKMDKQMKVEGSQLLFARFDQDGDLATKQAGDQQYRSTSALPLGSKDVSIRLEALADVQAKLDIHGVIKGSLPTGGKVIFIFARGSQMPMPIAATRLPVSSLPIEFHLRDANILMPNMPLPEQLQIVVRVDADGDPMTKGDGDIEVTSPLGPAVRQEAVEIVLGAR